MSEKSERLFEAIGNVNDKAVDEAAQAMEKRRKPRRWLRWTAGLAAALILAAGTGLLFLPRGEQTVSVLYPFAGDLNSRGALCPSLTLDGQPVEAALHPGRYSGGPYGLWAAWREGPWEVNLTQAENWEAYREVLSDGSYQAAALEDFPDLSGIPVVVYDFTDPWGPQPDDGSYPTIRAAFELSSGRSSVLTTGYPKPGRPRLRYCGAGGRFRDRKRRRHRYAV